MIENDHRKRLWAAAVVVVGGILLAGCGEHSARYPIEGRVEVDDRPVDHGYIYFLGKSAENEEYKVTGEIKDGRYAIPASKGLSVGTYRVVLSWPKKTGKQVSNDPPHKIDEVVEAMPKPFNSTTQSRLTAQVKPEPNTVDFLITSPKEEPSGPRKKKGN
jgi:hypothetical protein